MLQSKSIWSVLFIVSTLLTKIALGKISCVQSPEMAREAFQSMGNDRTQLFSLFGFDGNDANSILSQIVSSIDVSENLVLVSTNSPEDLYRIRKSAVSIGFVTVSDVLNEDANLLANIMALLENENSGQSGPKEIAFVLKGNDEVSTENAKKLLIHLVEDIRKMLVTMDRSTYLTEDVKITVHPFVGHELDDRIDSVFQDLQQTETLSGAEWIKYFDSFTAKMTIENVNPAETSAAEECFGLVDSLMIDVSGSLNSLSQSLISPSFLVSNVALENLELVLESAIQKNFVKHQSTYIRHHKSKSMVHASYVARTRIASALRPFFKRLVDATYAASMDSFEKGIRRISGADPRLVQKLRSQAAATQKGFIAKMNLYKKGFVAMCEKTTTGDDGLFSKQLLSRLSSIGLSSSFGYGKFNSARETRQLQTRLAEACADRERQLFLQGSYNPYIRDLPVPPIHFNFNYLLDPRAVLFNSEYSKLYDEHKEGLALDRADALQLPGVAGVPFDPNDHAVPNENKAWWRVIYDYYINDKF